MPEPPKKAPSFWFLCGLCWLVYAAAYFGRVNLSITLPALEATYGYSKTALGILASGFFFAYGAGQLVNGVLGDRYNPRFFVAAGIAAAALCNILFMVSGNLALMFLCWTANGYFQSMLWGPLVRIVADNVPPKHITKSILFVSSSTLAGYLVSFSVIGRISTQLGWKSAFLIPALILFVMALLWFCFLEKMVQTRQPSPHVKDSRTASANTSVKGTESAARFVIKSGLWLFALLCVINGVLKEGLTLWGTSFLTEGRGLSIDRALFIMSLAPLVNFFCMGLSGWLHKLCKHRAEHTAFWVFAAGVFFTALLRFSFTGSLSLMIFAFCGIFTAALASNTVLTAFIPLDFQKEKRVSTAAGFLDCSVYAGAALAGPAAGILAEKTGWSGVLNGWILVSAAGVAIAALIIRRRAGIARRIVK